MIIAGAVDVRAGAVVNIFARNQTTTASTLADVRKRIRAMKSAATTTVMPAYLTAHCVVRACVGAEVADKDVGCAHKVSAQNMTLAIAIKTKTTKTAKSQPKMKK